VTELKRNGESRPATGKASAADRVQSILSAAEATAEEIRSETEARVRDRIAEGDRAADYRIQAAEEEAAEILAEAQEGASRSREDAERYTRELIDEARQTAQEVHGEGLELVANLRQMGDSLRANAERILRDVQDVHSHLVAKIDRVERATRQPSAGRPRTRAERARALSRGPFDADGDGEAPDVPEFIPRR
jgi:vacuolar-type H+-ATPase subunit E/Vma4